MRVTPVSKVSNCCMVAVRALQSLVELPLEQLTPGFEVLPGTTAAGNVCTRLQNTGAPATETTGGYCAPALAEAMRSAILPPHPMLPTLLALDVCHSFCWSEWEKRFEGSDTVRARYCVRVVGWTNGPTFAWMATFLLFTSC